MSAKDDFGDFDLSLLQRLGDQVPLVDDEARRRAATRLDTLIRTQPTHRPRTVATKRLVALAAAAACVLVVTQFVVPSLRGADHARAVLLDLGAAADLRPALAIPPGAHFYEEWSGTETFVGRHATGDPTWRVQYEFIRNAWIASDGSGLVRLRTTALRWPTPEDAEMWRRAGSPALREVDQIEEESFEQGELFFVDADSIPEDVSQLRSKLERREVFSGPPGSLGTIDIVGDLLRLPYLAPEQRAALFEVASDIPGIVHDGTVTDGAGREGIGISITEGSTRLQLIFDPASSEVLGERTFEIRPDGEQVLMQEYTYLEAGIVASIDDRP